MWSETDVSELRQSLAYCSSPGECERGSRDDDDDDDGGWGQLLTRIPGLSGSPTSRHLERVGGLDERMRISLIHYL
jgi:hypothetical protein